MSLVLLSKIQIRARSTYVLVNEYVHLLAKHTVADSCEAGTTQRDQTTLYVLWAEVWRHHLKVGTHKKSESDNRKTGAVLNLPAGINIRNQGRPPFACRISGRTGRHQRRRLVLARVVVMGKPGKAPRI
jgi:hypothetical protein